MAATSGKLYPVGARYGSIFQLTGGLIAATNMTVYEGSQMVGLKAFEFNQADPRLIVHPGEDRIAMTDYLPAISASVGTIRVSRSDLVTNAMLTGVTTWTLADMTAMSWGTDLQGSEPTVMLFFYQQALNATTGERDWHAYIIPACKCIPKLSSMTDSAQDIVYNVTVSPVTTQPWGKVLALAAEGATENQVIEIHSDFKPWIAAWKSVSSDTDFNFSANHQGNTNVATKAKVFNATLGSDLTSAATIQTDDIALTAVTTGQIIVAIYELA